MGAESKWNLENVFILMFTNSSLKLERSLNTKIENTCTIVDANANDNCEWALTSCPLIAAYFQPGSRYNKLKRVEFYTMMITNRNIGFTISG